MSDPALQGYIDKWLKSRPAQALALPFLDPVQRELHLSVAALEHELVSATYTLSEPEVAATKINWWGEELSGAPVSGGRHPLTQALFANDSVRALDAALWLAPVMAALKQLDAATATDFPAQLAGAGALHGALATLETRLWFGPEADPARAARMAMLDHLLQALARLQSNVDAAGLPLPMSRLARHHLDRENLHKDSPERRQALHEQLHDLSREWRQAWHLDGPLSLFRGLDARLGQHWIARANRRREPLLALYRCQQRQTGLSTLWRAWAAGRAARRASQEHSVATVKQRAD